MGFRMQVSSADHQLASYSAESPFTPESSEKLILTSKKRISETFENGFGKDDRKIGHRRVHENGSVTYKKKPTTELMTAVQLGIAQSIGSLSAKPSRDILYEDFHVVVTVNFPRDGTNLTPAHHCSDFRFRTYAPDVFRYFRQIFKIKPADFLMSLCSDPLRELPNPGASGSIFYVTESDEFIIKTVQHKEAEFLQKLLPGYYMNLNQNPCTLLPKFYGLFCYQCGGKNIRFVVMNNIISSDVFLSEKFDLKGSTYKRKASKHEKSKPVPTLKDLDFVDIYPEGLMLEVETYDALVKTLDRDCRVLESFKIMDYSFLIGIYNIDNNEKQRQSNQKKASLVEVANEYRTVPDTDNKKLSFDESKVPKPRIGQYSTPMESIQAGSQNITPGQIPAKNGRGERLLLYVGIIDILQSYRLAKKLEHAFKSLVQDGDTVSVHHPQFYAHRFKKFFNEVVFKTVRPPVKRKSIAGRKSIVPADVESLPDVLAKRPDLLVKSNNMKTASSYSSVHTAPLYDSQSTLWKDSLHTYPTPHLSVNSLLSGGTLTPTNTQRTDATVSFTESSPSVSADNLLDDGSSSNTTLNRRFRNMKLQHYEAAGQYDYSNYNDDHNQNDVTLTDCCSPVQVEIESAEGRVMNINDFIKVNNDRNVDDVMNINDAININEAVINNNGSSSNSNINVYNSNNNNNNNNNNNGGRIKNEVFSNCINSNDPSNIPCVELEDCVTRL